MQKKLIIRGRHISSADIKLINAFIRRYRHKGRSYISRALCQHWGWYQPNGALKEIACREILRKLEAKGLVNLPASKSYLRKTGIRTSPNVPPHDTSPIETCLKNIRPVTLKLVRHTASEKLFNGLIHRYHYLGYCQTVGAHLKYIALSGKRPLACLTWGAGAWKIACRDRFIGWSPEMKRRNLHLLINNTRFLILPWVHVPHLASHLLGLSAKILPQDWQKIYAHSIVLLESFVDVGRFQGTCYKAANWIRTGETSGRGKYDFHNLHNKPVKAVFVYPLHNHFREILQHE